MKKFTALCLLLLFALPAIAVEGGDVMYVGGTTPGFTAGSIGRLETTDSSALIFLYAGNKLTIPYAAIESYEYSKDVTRHLGALPAIAVGMVKMRRHSHYFRISYSDSNNVAQAVVFEVPKQMPRTLQAVLQARSPQAHKACKPCGEPN